MTERVDHVAVQRSDSPQNPALIGIQVIPGFLRPTIGIISPDILAWWALDNLMCSTLIWESDVMMGRVVIVSRGGPAGIVTLQQL